MAYVYAVNIIHKVQGLLPANVLVKGSAKVVRYVVLAVGKGTGTAKTAHY